MTLTQARKRMKTRRDRYVLGYASSRNTLYGKGTPVGHYSTDWSYTDPLSLREAQARLAEMPCAGAVIFELRPIAINR